MACTAPRLSAGMDGVRNYSPRGPLMTLTMNQKVRRGEDRIMKPAQRTQTRARNIRRNFIQRRREPLRLCPEQRGRAVAIYNRLRDQCLANRAPTLRVCDKGVLELEYPQYRFRRLLGDLFMPALTRVEVQQLRETVVRYTISLYDAQIPYAPDLTTLEVVSKKSNDPIARPIYRPFLNTFDFDIDPNDETLPWAELRDAKLQRVKAQFAVLEVLAELSNPSEAQTLSLSLEPNVVAGVLREFRQPAKRNLAIRHVTTYSTELGQFVIECTGHYLRSLPWRTSYPMLTLAGCLDYCETVSHVLHMMDNPKQDGRSKADGALSQIGSVHSDRVALLIVRAALLVHCYAKTVTVMASHGLLEASKKDTVDSYTTNEQFTFVVQARHEAEQGFHELAEKGYQLDEDVMYFFRGVY